MFHFLVSLSYGKQHSKTIISVAKILQLCDGLMASGQAPLSYCIPSLEPIMVDIFLVRNTTNTNDIKELETTREVFLSMLLRLLEYHEVVDLLIVVLNNLKCGNNMDKWLEWSHRVYSVLLIILKHNKMHLEDSESVSSAVKLLNSLHPNVYKAIDQLLVTLYHGTPSEVMRNCSIFSFTRVRLICSLCTSLLDFAIVQIYYTKHMFTSVNYFIRLQESSLSFVNCWLGKVIVLLLIVVQIKESVFLAKIYETLKDLPPMSVFKDVECPSDPLNVTNVESCFKGMSPESVFIMFMFRIIDIVLERCLHIAHKEQNVFLVKQLSQFLMICIYIFQSGM